MRRRWQDCRSADRTWAACWSDSRSSSRQRRRRIAGTLFEAAAEAAGTYRAFPLLLLDVPMESAIEFDFARKLIEAAPDVLVTIPFGDLATLERFKTAGLTPDVLEPPGASDLTALKRYLFATRQPPERDALGDVRLFSAPGEGRECVEIAPADPGRSARRSPLRRDGGVRAVAARLRRPHRPRVLARGDPGVVRSRHRPAAPVGPRVPRAPRVRGRASLRGAVCGVPLALPGAGCRIDGNAAIDPASRGRPVFGVHRNRGTRRRARLPAAGRAVVERGPAASRRSARNRRRSSTARCARRGNGRS